MSLQEEFPVGCKVRILESNEFGTDFIKGDITEVVGYNKHNPWLHLKSLTHLGNQTESYKYGKDVKVWDFEPKKCERINLPNLYYEINDLKCIAANWVNYE